MAIDPRPSVSARPTFHYRRASVARQLPNSQGGRGRARQLVDDRHSGSHVTPARTTLAECVNESWLPMTATRVKPTTLHSYRRNLEIHVLPTLGSNLLKQLTPTMLNTLYAVLALTQDSERTGLSAKAISYISTIVHKALVDAVDADLIARNIADRAKPPRPSRRAMPGIQSWDTDELRAVPRARLGSSTRRDLAPGRDDRHAKRRSARPALERCRPQCRAAVRSAGARRGRL